MFHFLIQGQFLLIIFSIYRALILLSQFNLSMFLFRFDIKKLFKDNFEFLQVFIHLICYFEKLQ